VHLGWKGGWKGAYKKGMWQQQSKEQRKHSTEQQQNMQSCCVPVTPCEHQWGEHQQVHPAAVAAGSGEGHMHSEQQQVLGGSDPEDVEAACVLVGASMGRAHSTEVFGAFDPHQHSYQQQLLYPSEEQPLTHRFHNSTGGAGAGRQNGRRRGHNWSKALNRPPRPPPAQQQQQWTGAARRHSFNGSLQQASYSNSGDMCQQARVPGQEGLYTAAAPPAGPSRPPSAPAGSSGLSIQATPLPAAAGQW
jgi:hypothetical protein